MEGKGREEAPALRRFLVIGEVSFSRLSAAAEREREICLFNSWEFSLVWRTG